MIYVNNKEIASIYRYPNFKRILVSKGMVVFEEELLTTQTKEVYYSRVNKTNNRSVGFDPNFGTGVSFRLAISNNANIIGARYTATGGNAGRVILYFSKNISTEAINKTVTISRGSDSIVFTITPGANVLMKKKFPPAVRPMLIRLFTDGEDLTLTVS